MISPTLPHHPHHSLSLLFFLIHTHTHRGHFSITQSTFQIIKKHKSNNSILLATRGVVGSLQVYLWAHSMKHKTRRQSVCWCALDGVHIQEEMKCIERKGELALTYWGNSRRLAARQQLEESLLNGYFALAGGRVSCNHQPYRLNTDRQTDRQTDPNTHTHICTYTLGSETVGGLLSKSEICR